MDRTRRTVKWFRANEFWGCISRSGFFLHFIQRINAGYPALFDKRDDKQGDSEGESAGDVNNFTKHFGWLYNAKMVADFEGIPVESVWSLKVIHFLNDLLYLKLKLENEHRQKSNWCNR